MQIKVQLPATERSPETVVNVEAFATNHPELAIHPLWCNMWAITHIPSGQMVIYGFFKKELAIAAANMIAASGMRVGPGYTCPRLLDSFKAFVGWRETEFAEMFAGRGLAVA